MQFHQRAAGALCWLHRDLLPAIRPRSLLGQEQSDSKKTWLKPKAFLEGITDLKGTPNPASIFAGHSLRWPLGSTVSFKDDSGYLERWIKQIFGK